MRQVERIVIDWPSLEKPEHPYYPKLVIIIAPTGRGQIFRGDAVVHSVISSSEALHGACIASGPKSMLLAIARGFRQLGYPVSESVIYIA